MKRTLKGLTVALLIMMLLTSLTVPALAGNEEGTKVNGVLEGAVEFNGNYYKLINIKLKWESAKKYCEGVGGHLATITSEEENEFCRSLWMAAKTDNCWLGATDGEIEGVWQWITGETWSFTNWMPGEPNGGTGANYLQFLKGSNNSGWDDKVPASEPFLCEWEKEDLQSVRNDYGYVTSPNEIYNNALYFNGNMYKAFDYGMTYDEAVSYCDKLGGHLAIVTSEKEDMALASYIFKNGMQECSIGASDLAKEGVWKWADGSSLTYTNWAPGEPNGKYDYEDHLEYNPDGNWNDARWRNRFACEWENACVLPDGTVGTHTFGTEKVLMNPTCTSKGEAKHTCQNCGITVIYSLDELPHSYGESVIVSGNALIPPIVHESSCVECNYVLQEKDWNNSWALVGIFAVTLVTWVVFLCLDRERLY